MSINKFISSIAAATMLTASVAYAENLTIATVNNGDMIRMQGLTDDFTAKTGHTVEWVTLEENVLRQRVTTDITTKGGAFDIMTIGMYETPIWGSNGWLVPLDDLSADYNVGDLLPAMAGGLSHDGTLYAAPFYGESSMVMYRTDLMAKAGLEMPRAPSWNFIAKAARAMTDRSNDINGICLRGKAGWGEGGAFITAVANSFGARWFDENMKPQLDSTAWNEAVSFYVDLLANYGPPGSEGNSFNEILALYNQDKCGLWIDATIAASFLENPNVAYAQSPNAGNPVGANWLWAWAMAIPAGSPNADAAGDFIEWATSKAYVQAVGNHPDFGWASVPTGQRASTYDIPEFKAVAGFAAAEMAAIDSAAPEATDLKPYVGVQFVAIPEFPEIGSAFGQEMAAALSGAKSVEDALAAAQAAAVSIMNEAGY